MMELLAPAGSVEKLRFAFAYGADAAYLGVEDFSLRARAGQITGADGEAIRRIKGNKPVYGALNIFFHNHDLDRLKAREESLGNLPLDAFILSDLGPVRYLQQTFPPSGTPPINPSQLPEYRRRQDVPGLGFHPAGAGPRG
jgi:putative protease